MQRLKYYHSGHTMPLYFFSARITGYYFFRHLSLSSVISQKNVYMKMPELFSTYYNSPVGLIKIMASSLCIHEVLFCPDESESISYASTNQVITVLQHCINELQEYFDGNRRSFNVPVYQEGTAFQQRVWNELLKIPYGATINYLELSKRIGDVKAIRAAASTNGKNRIAIIIPCHRVIGSNRELVGYAGGLPNKRWLLQHEAKFACGVQTLF